MASAVTTERGPTMASDCEHYPNLCRTTGTRGAMLYRDAWCAPCLRAALETAEQGLAWAEEIMGDAHVLDNYHGTAWLSEVETWTADHREGADDGV